MAHKTDVYVRVHEDKRTLSTGQFVAAVESGEKPITLKGQGYPLVLFHGWGFDHRIWADLAPLLSACYTVYLVDLPGFGQTNFMEWAEFKHVLLMQLPAEFAYPFLAI